MGDLRWTVGEFTVVPFIETEAGAAVNDIITDATPSALSEIDWLIPDFADQFGSFRAVIQSFLVMSDNIRMVVDPCVGNDKKREGMAEWSYLHTDFLHRFSEVGCAPESIDFVVCTHLHYDHVGWNTQLVGDRWQPTFPRARYIFCEPEFAYWASNPSNEIEDHLEGIRDSVMPIVDAKLADLVQCDAVLYSGISLVPTPGHTPFHVSVQIKSREQQALITGDVFHHPCQLARPSWGTISDTYAEQGHASREHLIERCADTDTLVIGSHFAPPTAGRLVRDGGGARLVV
jgi:glyoxylase-like metal-dependent hydrolase (beta-lactamase superfamily II)